MRKILVLAIRAIGDMVLVTPAIHALAEAFPDASLTVVTEAFSADVFEANPRIHEIIVIDRWAQRGLSWRRKLAMDINWLRRIRSGGYDTVVDLFCGPRSGQMALLSGASVRVAEGVRGRRFFYTKTVPVVHAGSHLVEQKMQIVAALTGPVPAPPLEIFLRPEERAAAAETLRKATGSATGPFVGLFPGAGWEHKQWPAERYAQLADRFATEGSAIVVVLGGSLDMEACRAVADAATSRPVVLSGIPRLRESIALIDRMDIFVSNDTGPMHIAAGLGVPTIGLFGPSDLVKYRPWGPHAHTISANLPCSPCPQHQETCHRHGRRPRECMERIPVERVHDMAKVILGGVAAGLQNERTSR